MNARLTGRTVVAIAHRLYTAYDAGRIAVMADGRILELGSHEDLLTADGQYAHRCRKTARAPLDGSVSSQGRSSISRWSDADPGVRLPSVVAVSTPPQPGQHPLPGAGPPANRPESGPESSGPWGYPTAAGGPGVGGPANYGQAPLPVSAVDRPYPSVAPGRALAPDLARGLMLLMTSRTSPCSSTERWGRR